MKTLKGKTILTLAIVSLLSFLCFVCVIIKLLPVGVTADEQSIVFGDVNSDGELDVTDSIRLLKYLTDDTVEVDETLCDANADDEVNTDDAKRIIDVINGYDLPLYKTVNTPATCSTDGISARWSSKQDDANVYYTVTPKIEHENGVQCSSCGKTYVGIEPYGNHTYAYSSTELYANIDNSLANMGDSEAFKEPVTVIYNGSTVQKTPTKSWKNGGLYFSGLSATKEGSTFVIPADTEFVTDEIVYVMKDTATYTFGTTWTWTVEHEDNDGDGLCDGFGCDVEFVSITISSQRDAWATATNGFYANTSTAVLEGTLSSPDKILYNGVEVSATGFGIQSDSQVFIYHGQTLAQGDVVVIPQGYRMVSSVGKVYVVAHAVQFTWNGSKALFNTLHLDDDFDGKCDGCETAMVGIAVAKVERYDYATSPLYFHVNTTAFASYTNWGAFTALSPVLFDGVPTMPTMAKGDQADFLSIAGFGTAVEGTTVLIPEGFTFVAGDTIYYFRDGYTFTYNGSKWTYESVYNSSLSTLYSADPILVLNEDADILTRLYNQYDGDVTDLETKTIEYFNDAWKNKGISDLLLNFDGRVPSEYNYIGERYGLTEFRGQATDASFMTTNVVATYAIWNSADALNGFDPIAKWIEMSKENNITPWLSFRMNDCHYQGDVIAASDFQYEAMQNGWLNKDKGRSDYYQWCLNYQIAEVRQYQLNYIAEMLDRYNGAYGIELDFQREIHCFPSASLDNIQYMNSFMAELKNIIDAAEAKYGHEIKVMARVNRDINHNKYFGFDLINWADNGWVDVLVPSSSYGSTDTDMPVAEWIATFEPYGIEVIPAFEKHLDAAGHTITKETVSAFANAYLGAGAKKIYAFNVFANMSDGGSDFWPYVNSEAGIMSCEKRYVVTYENAFPWGYGQWKPLPMTVNGTSSLGIQVGNLRNSADKIIIVGIAEGVDVENTLSIMANGKACTYIGETTNAYITTYSPAYKLYAFRVSGSVNAIDNQIEFTFSADTSVVLQYVEFFNGFFS